MIQRPTSIEQYQSDIFSALAQTGIRQLAPGGKARAFVDIVADKIGRLETAQFNNLGQTLLPFATGQNLDLLGEIYGVPRLGQQNSRVDTNEQNFLFYVRRGTFGDINGGQNIYIPADVSITTLASNGPVYLSDPVILYANNNRQFFSARSASPGSAGNVAASLLGRHNFTAYRDSAFGSLLVTNSYGIVGGRDQESDEAYRYRIYLKIRSQNGANEAALRFELLRLPGIQDVVFEAEAGKYNVYVYSISPVVSTSVLSSVQEVLNQKSAFPIYGVALAPDLVGVSLVTTIRLSTSISVADQNILVSQAQNAVERYVNNLQINEPLVLNEIADRIRNADSRIIDVGQPNRPLDEVLIWRSRNDGTRYSRFLLSNAIPAIGERIMVEDRVNAISLQVV